VATLRHQIATNVLTVTKYRDLLKKVRANRPNDDLEIIRKAYDYSLEHHKGQSRATGEREGRCRQGDYFSASLRMFVPRGALRCWRHQTASLRPQ